MLTLLPYYHLLCIHTTYVFYIRHIWKLYRSFIYSGLNIYIGSFLYTLHIWFCNLMPWLMNHSLGTPVDNSVPEGATQAHWCPPWLWNRHPMNLLDCGFMSLHMRLIYYSFCFYTGLCTNCDRPLCHRSMQLILIVSICEQQIFDTENNPG